MRDFDIPVSFGYKLSWFAIRQSNPLTIAKTLGLKNVREATWAAGVARAYQYEESTFVTPGVRGWSFALLGRNWPEAGDSKFSPTLIQLSDAFQEVHYYGTHRVSDYQAWARAAHGKLTRAYGVCGDVLIDIGPITPEETELNFKPRDLSENEVPLDGMNVDYDNLPWFPDEEFVMQLAGRWSFDPQTLESVEASDVQEVSGIIGEASFSG